VNRFIPQAWRAAGRWSLFALVLIFVSAPAAHAQRDDERMDHLKDQIRQLEIVVTGTKSPGEKTRLDEKLQRLKQELAILEQRQTLESRERALQIEQPVGTLDELRDRLRAIDSTVEEAEARAKELASRRKQAAAERDAVATQGQAERGKSAASSDRIAELDERKFTKNEEVRALALEREAAEAEVELARDADRLRGWLKSAEAAGAHASVRALLDAYGRLRSAHTAGDEMVALANNYGQSVKLSQNSLELAQQKLAKFDEELALLEKQTGFFSRDAAMDRLLAQQRSQKNALVERMPFMVRQVEALKRAQEIQRERSRLATLATVAEQDHFEELASSYVHRLRWPTLAIVGLVLLYFLIAYGLLPFRYRNEGLLLARRLSCYLLVVVGAGVIAGFLFDDISMVAATLGVVSAGVVISLQDVCTSGFGWFVIMAGGKFRIGDRLEIDGVRGDVIDIQLLRTTLIEINGWLGTDAPTGRVVIVPNNFIFKTKVFNFTHGHPFIWHKIDVTVTYSTPVASALSLFQRILEEETREEFEAARLAASAMQKRYGVEDADYRPKIYTQIADSGVTLTLFYVTHYRRNSMTRNRINRRLIAEMETHTHIQFAYHTMHVLQGKIAPDAPTAVLGADVTTPPFPVRNTPPIVPRS
jgi:small-conductance mechanosensitive channel